MCVSQSTRFERMAEANIKQNKYKANCKQKTGAKTILSYSWKFLIYYEHQTFILHESLTLPSLKTSPRASTHFVGKKLVLIQTWKKHPETLFPWETLSPRDVFSVGRFLHVGRFLRGVTSQWCLLASFMGVSFSMVTYTTPCNLGVCTLVEYKTTAAMCTEHRF